MAIIPRYTSRALPPGAQPGLITGAQSRGEAGAGLARAFGGAVAEGVDYARRRDEAARTAARTTAAAKLTERIVVEKRRNLNLDLRDGESALAAAEAETTRGRARAVALARTGGAPAKDMARISLADFDGATGKQAEALKTRPHLKARFDAMVESSRAPHELRMLTLENERRAGEEKTVLAAALGELAQAATDDPAMAPGVAGRGLAQIESAMDAGMVTPEEAAAMQGEFADNVHMAAMRGQIAQDPALALAKLESGEFNDIFEAPARDQLLGEARTTARVKQAGASAAARARRRGLEIDMKGHLAALDETGAADNAVAARARAELPEIEYAAFQQGQVQSRERHATRAEYAFMTEAEIETDIAQQSPGGGPRDSDERAAAHAIRAETRDEVLAARAADPAGWAMRDEAVAAAFSAAQENPDDPALARKAMQARLALQNEIGIKQPRLLSEAERDEIAGQLAQATPADRPALIADLRARYGQHAGMLAAELAGEVDANTALLLAHADMPHLPRLIAKGMEKTARDGPPALKVASPDEIGRLPTLPIIDKGENGGRKLGMSQMKPGQHYRTADGGVMLYDGEALVTVKVESKSTDPADPNTPTPPLPLGKASPERETAVKGVAYKRDEQGNPVAADMDGESVEQVEVVDLEEAKSRLPSGLVDANTALEPSGVDKPVGREESPIGDDPKREFREWPEDVKQQVQKPRREFSKFYYGTTLINIAKKQGALSKIAGGASPQVFVIPNQQDQIMNDPEHPYNVYAGATPEQRREIDRATAEEAKAFAQNWIRNTEALEGKPETPKFKGKTLEPSTVGKVADSAIKAVGKTPVLKELSGTDEILRRTLVEEGYDPLDAESVASAVVNPEFWPKLQKNLDEHWGDAAVGAVAGAAKPFVDWVYTPGGENSQRSGTPEESADEPGEFSNSVKKQLRKPKREFGEFTSANSLINHALEQEELSKVAAGASPQIFGIPNQQDAVLNDKDHPYNIYASASAEERGELNEIAYEKSLEFAEDWIRHRNALKQTPKLPEFKDDPDANTVGSLIEASKKALRTLPGVGALSGANASLYQTIVELGYDPDDPESVAVATMDPKFWRRLKNNIGKYWGKTIGKEIKGLVKKVSPL